MVSLILTMNNCISLLILAISSFPFVSIFWEKSPSAIFSITSVIFLTGFTTRFIILRMTTISTTAATTAIAAITISICRKSESTVFSFTYVTKYQLVCSTGFKLTKYVPSFPFTERIPLFSSVIAVPIDLYRESSASPRVTAIIS